MVEATPERSGDTSFLELIVSLLIQILTVLSPDPPVPAGDFGAALVLPVLRVHDVSEQAERDGDRGPLLGRDSRLVTGWVGQLVEVTPPAGEDQVPLRALTRWIWEFCGKKSHVTSFKMPELLRTEVHDSSIAVEHSNVKSMILPIPYSMTGPMKSVGGVGRSAGLVPLWKWLKAREALSEGLASRVG